MTAQEKALLHKAIDLKRQMEFFLEDMNKSDSINIVNHVEEFKGMMQSLELWIKYSFKRGY